LLLLLLLRSDVGKGRLARAKGGIRRDGGLGSIGLRRRVELVLALALDLRLRLRLRLRLWLWLA
jgi:hypothetical protein